jgi:hypothetical protein
MFSAPATIVGESVSPNGRGDGLTSGVCEGYVFQLLNALSQRGGCPKSLQA